MSMQRAVRGFGERTVDCLTTMTPRKMGDKDIAADDGEADDNYDHDDDDDDCGLGRSGCTWMAPQPR